MKLISYLHILLFGILMIFGELFGSEREITANYLMEAPKIDGKLDDDAWKNGVWHTDFMSLSNPEKLAGVQTEFQIAHDDENLYLAARMHEPEPRFLKIEELRRDGSVCQDDSLEVMLDPVGDGHNYFHFGVNAIGAQYDESRSLKGKFHDVKWNSNWKVATKIGTKEWTLEMTIPLAELPLKKESKGTWSFNVARQRWAGKKRELSSFSPMKRNFHIAQKFSKLHFREARFEKFFWKIRRPFDYHIEADQGNWILTGKVQIKNDASQNENIKILFKQIDKKYALVGQVIVDELPIGKEKEYVFRLPVAKQEPLELQIEVVNGENTEEVYRLKRAVLDVNYKAMELELISPWYRNSIYPSEHLTEVKVLVRFALSQKVLMGSKLHLRLVGEKAQNTLYEAEVTNLLNKQEVNLPLGDISPGEYIIEGEVVDAQGNILARSSKVLRKLRHEDNEWRLNSSGTLLHNGEQFLPQGWLRILPDELELINFSIYNAFFLKIDEMYDEEKIKKCLDSVQKANGYAVIYPYAKKRMIKSNSDLGRMLTSEEIKVIQQRVRNLKKHPALMGWIIADQPEFDDALPERMEQIYAIITEEDAFHPVIIVNSSIGGITQYLGKADITLTTTFIPFVPGEGAAKPINLVSYYLDVAKKIAREKVPFWVGLQVYDYGHDWSDGERPLSFVELRNMVYQSVIHGVKGFFWHDYRYIYNDPAVKFSADYLARELHLLKDAVLAPEVKETMLVQSEDKKSIHVCQKTVGKDHYVFVVNTGSLEQFLKFEGSLLKEIDKLYVLSENRIVTVRDGKFNDNFDPYATHIYTTREFKGNLGSLFDVEKAIELANKTKKKEGNLAFRDSGIKIVASSYNHSSSVNNINDGIFDGLSWVSQKGEPLPQWIELSWPKSISVGKVVIYSDTIENAKVQINRDGAWVDVGDFVRRSGAHLRATFPEKDLQQMRILITGKKPGVPFVTISEIEVYNTLTKVVD